MTLGRAGSPGSTRGRPWRAPRSSPFGDGDAPCSSDDALRVEREPGDRVRGKLLDKVERSGSTLTWASATRALLGGIAHAPPPTLASASNSSVTARGGGRKQVPAPKALSRPLRRVSGRPFGADTTRSSTRDRWRRRTLMAHVTSPQAVIWFVVSRAGLVRTDHRGGTEGLHRCGAGAPGHPDAAIRVALIANASVRVGQQPLRAPAPRSRPRRTGIRRAPACRAGSDTPKNTTPGSVANAAIVLHTFSSDFAAAASGGARPRRSSWRCHPGAWPSPLADRHGGVDQSPPRRTCRRTRGWSAAERGSG